MVVGSLLVPSSILVNNLGGVNGLGKVGGCVHDIIFAALRTSFPTPNNFYCHETGCKHRMMAQNCLQTALARGPINTTRYRRPMVANGPFGRWVGRARVCNGGFRTRRVRPIKPGSAPERHEVTKRRGLIDADGSAIQWLYCERKELPGSGPRGNRYGYGGTSNVALLI